MSNLHYLCLLAHSNVQQISVWCPTHIVLCFWFVFSASCVPYIGLFILISLSVFSNVYSMESVPNLPLYLGVLNYFFYD